MSIRKSKTARRSAKLSKSQSSNSQPRRGGKAQPRKADEPGIRRAKQSGRHAIFISYASEDREAAYKINLALEERGFATFFDRKELEEGEGYHKKICANVHKSDVFVFLVSSHSLAKGRYTLNELEYAREKWSHPNGHVLPVLIGDPGRIAEEVRQLWIYLSEVTPVRSTGHIGPAVAERAEYMVRPRSRPRIAAPDAAVSTLGKYRCGDYLKGGAAKSLYYTNVELDEDILQRQIERGGDIEAGELKEKLKSASILKKPRLLTVRGRFFPSALLSFGWWERVNRHLETGIQWNDAVLQRWLFSGFEQWAPSWDMNDWSNDSPFNLIGQIGENDEADSIPVLIKSAPKAKEIREQMAQRVVANANVRGLLCHESHLRSWYLENLDEKDTAFLESIKEMTSAQYYLILLDEAESHKVDILDRRVDFYSGYIWQCWSPKEWVSENPYDTRLPGAYFVWEHSNLAQPDVIKYSLDSLDRKVQFLNRRLQKQLNLSGELVLLQHLMPEARLCADGGKGSLTPAIPIDQFRNLFLSRDQAEAAA